MLRDVDREVAGDSCFPSDPPSARAEDSCRTPGDLEGMMHPNHDGTGVVAALTTSLRRTLAELGEPSWRPRPVAGPAERPGLDHPDRPNERCRALRWRGKSRSTQ